MAGSSARMGRSGRGLRPDGSDSNVARGVGGGSLAQAEASSGTRQSMTADLPTRGFMSRDSESYRCIDDDSSVQYIALHETTGTKIRVDKTSILVRRCASRTRASSKGGANKKRFKAATNTVRVGGTGSGGWAPCGDDGQRQRPRSLRDPTTSAARSLRKSRAPVCADGGTAAECSNSPVPLPVSSMPSGLSSSSSSSSSLSRSLGESKTTRGHSSNVISTIAKRRRTSEKRQGKLLASTGVTGTSGSVTSDGSVGRQVKRNASKGGADSSTGPGLAARTSGRRKNPFAIAQPTGSDTSLATTPESRTKLGR